MQAGYAYHITDCQLKAEIEGQMMIQINDREYTGVLLTRADGRRLVGAVRSW